MADLETLAPPPGRTKACSACGAAFMCGAGSAAGGCWCNDMPVLPVVDPDANCLCRACLSEAIARQTG